MKYFSVDRKEGQYTILQNTVTKKMYEIKTSKLPPFLNDGDILKKIGFNYEFDYQKTKRTSRSNAKKNGRKLFKTLKQCRQKELSSLDKKV